MYIFFIQLGIARGGVCVREREREREIMGTAANSLPIWQLGPFSVRQRDTLHTATVMEHRKLKQFGGFLFLLDQASAAIVRPPFAITFLVGGYRGIIGQSSPFRLCSGVDILLSLSTTLSSRNTAAYIATSVIAVFFFFFFCAGITSPDINP